MKKNFTLFIFTFSLIFAISCVSNSNLQAQDSSILKSETKSESKQKSIPQKMWTIILNDNCPQTTAALKAEIALRATVENYNGTEIFTYNENSPKNYLQEFQNYISYCEQIKDSIKKFSINSECLLEFNTEKDASGEALDFSSSEKTVQTLKYLAQNQISQVWAIYKF